MIWSSLTLAERGERIDRASSTALEHQLVLGTRDVQQVAGLLHDHQPVAGGERLGELGRHQGDPVAAVHEHLARCQLSQ